MNIKNATICFVLVLALSSSYATAACVNSARPGFYSQDWVGTWYGISTGVSYTVTANGDHVHMDYTRSGQACSIDGDIRHTRPPNRDTSNSKQDYVEGTFNNPAAISTEREGNILLWMTDCTHIDGIVKYDTSSTDWMQDVYGFEILHKV